MGRGFWCGGVIRISHGADLAALLPATRRSGRIYEGDKIYSDYTVDEETGVVYYYHADHLGSVRVVTTCGVGAGDCVPGETATVLQRPVYTAFGELVTRAGIALTPTRYLYAGAWGYESDLGAAHAGGAPGDDALPYQHLGYRWYNPASGRFLQRDPIGISGGLNAYAYANNNPMMRVDPFGLFTINDYWEDVVDLAQIAAGLAMCMALAMPGPDPVKVIEAVVVVYGIDAAKKIATRETSPTRYSIARALHGWVLLWDWFFEDGPYYREPQFVAAPETE